MAQLVRIGPPLFVAPCSRTGMLVPGNIDINDRPLVHFQGSIATVRSMSFGKTAKIHGRARHVEILVPTVVGGRVIGEQAAIASFERTHRHLGIFDNWHHADAYAVCLHKYQAKVFSKFIQQAESFDG